ncbi:MAG: hypothetical protein FJ216_02185 [Ignavibacteria bacterium]|nr:hypothetical protein [Ignavibacteria bacterium]
MKIFKLIILLLIVSVPLSVNVGVENENDSSLFVNNKIFIKTKYELKISEATGKIEVATGFAELDVKNEKYKVNKIERIFNLFNGNKELYEKYEMSRMYTFHIEPSGNISDIVRDYDKDEIVEFAEPVFVGYGAGQRDLMYKKDYKSNNNSDIIKDKQLLVPDDEYFYKQWYLQNNGQIRTMDKVRPKKGADINIVPAWDIEQGSEEVIIAILDSGIREDIPDFMGRIWRNKKEIPNNKIDDDLNGYVDDYNGWDFAYDDKYIDDGFGHGTNIATVIGAGLNNRIGFAGINGKSKMMICKNLNDNNYGEYEWWAKSVKYATDNGAHVINMSEGGADYSKILETACNYAKDNGTLVVSSMMNKNNGKDYYPACFKSVLAVGATDADDRRVKEFTWGGGSCWGKHNAVVAPGNKIYGYDYDDPDNYDSYWSGTSQSTAIVSALASLLLSQDKTRTPDDLRSIIVATAVDQVGDPTEDVQGWDPYYGYGRVDFYRALTYSLPVQTYQRERVEEKQYYEQETKEGAETIERKPGEKTEQQEKKSSRTAKPKPR